MRSLVVTALIVAVSGAVVAVRRHRIEARAIRREITLQEATHELRAAKNLWIGFVTILTIVTLIDVVLTRR